MPIHKSLNLYVLCFFTFKLEQSFVEHVLDQLPFYLSTQTEIYLIFLGSVYFGDCECK
ncbi:hypothetical protein BRARA_E02810 [Brassica rapa]|uniref:Uncharacterized protein n=1 Tax=Brassica campestris TaxID=3711 RepID=A0A397ZDX2_BRACM|nr:hypothetical protein BRARA_E02810 [Brassica rapa]